MNGKIDWFGAGLPREGGPAPIVRLVDLVDRDVVTCLLSDTVAMTRERLGDGYGIVVNDARIVLGVVTSGGLGDTDHHDGGDGDAKRTVEELMVEAPSTYRPHLSARAILKGLEDDEGSTSHVLVTDTEGRLVGTVPVAALSDGVPVE